MLGKIISYDWTDNSVVLNGKGFNIYIDVLSNNIVNIAASRGERPAPSQAVVMKRQNVELQVEESDGYIDISTASFRLRVSIEDSIMEIDDGDGFLLKDIELNLSDDDRSCTIDVREGEHFYGLGEKTGFLDKKGYRYTMWNTDCYDTHTEGTDTLYESYPFYIGFNQEGSYGIYFDNTFRTYFDMGKSDPERVRFGAEHGPMGFFFIYGRDIKDVVKGYTEVTGRMDMPPLWALGYQQSKYSYYPQDRVVELAKSFREKDIPADVIYLDIHYMDGFRVFTFDKERFPDPKAMIDELEEMGFKVVTIIDPGLKADGSYSVFAEGIKNHYFVTDKDGLPFTGKVWPGLTCLPDFSRDDVKRWWGDNHKEFIEIGIAGIWNDMNEPAVMDTPTKTMPEDMVHQNNGKPIRHEEFHNVYALNMAMATKDALLRFRPNERTFILTRAAFSGIQRYAAVWTGDNRSYWEHLKMSMPMLLNIGLSGEPFCGADIGGFTDDCSEELLIRWTQVGVFYPFCRNHNGLESKDQEPWAFGRRAEDITREFIKLRYRLLPYMYNLFYEANTTGIPVMRPLIMEYPGDEMCAEVFDEFMLGESILVAPVYEPGKRVKDVYLPKGRWIAWWTGEEYQGGRYYLVDAPLDRMPIFIKAGAVLPMARPMKSTSDGMVTEFHIFPGTMSGEYVYYEDDCRTLNYMNGEYNLYRISYSKGAEAADIKVEKLYYGYSEGQRQFQVVLRGEKNIEKVRVNGQAAEPVARDGDVIVDMTV
ncbi:MAG: glycoside hydrolase family 31 protein [Thermoanaerobacteraceae bacterium]|nr:glycoside hydrolase family 31 protein [Thermoanaerobacteraceae bacterium]